MGKTTITIDLSPDDWIILKSLGDFYFRNDSDADRLTIEMALEHLAADAKMVSETIKSQIGNIKK